MMLGLFGILLCAATSLNAQNGEDKEPNIEKKMEQCIAIVGEAVNFLKQKPIGEACRSFQREIRWRRGEIFPFVFESNGACFVHDDDINVIWKNFDTQKTTGDMSFVQEMLKVGERGGWVSYEWDNGYKQAYVKIVKKGEKTYIVGAGFFPESPQFKTQQLVKTAISYLKENGLSQAVDTINNPVGMFVRGDIYLWIYDLEGTVMAHGENLAMVGQNLIDWQDADGKFRNREIIKIVSRPEGKGWIEYNDRGAAKRAYVEKVIDPQSKKEFVIGGGYYPDIDGNAVESFVKKAIAHLRANPSKTALSEFSNKAGGFVKGPMTIFVYSPDGIMLADAQNPAFIGQDLSKSRDSEGRFITQLILNQANTFGKGWVSFMDKRAYRNVYVEKVETPDGLFIVGSGYWPSRKSVATESLVEKASSFLETHEPTESFLLFSSPSNDYIRGDLSVFVYDTTGTCFAYGLDRGRIWSNDINVLDSKGQRISDRLLATAAAGGGWVEYPMNNAIRRAYVRQVDKNGGYIIGSGYYL